ncbi:MAG: ABC transporter substrate-binding protein [Burkholderiales bacterium]|nr:ABC transporter substrate-binding protein [Burkholderiales bacterium]
MGSRRAFLGQLLVFASACAAAQGRAYRLGYLSARTSRGPLDDAFFAALTKLGYAEGHNLVVDYRWASNDLARLPPLAQELAALPLDVIVTATTAGTRAAMRATGTIPIVMAASADPVAAGLVASLGRPGGNVTGLSLQTTDIAQKRLQLLREIVPGVSQVALLAERVRDLSQGTTPAFVAESRAAATQMGIVLVVQEIGKADELDTAFAAYRRAGAKALVVQVTPLFLQHSATVTGLAARERLPAMYETRDFVDNGGLVSYGPDVREAYRRAAIYVDRILKGARPADLPVEQPRDLSLAINLRAAKALGLSVPGAVLARADAVIE